MRLEQARELGIGQGGRELGRVPVPLVKVPATAPLWLMVAVSMWLACTWDKKAL